MSTINFELKSLKSLRLSDFE